MDNLTDKINQLKKDKNAIILSHTYQPGEIQDIADYVGDSFGLSVTAAEEKNADIILFCGVRFMAETAAILSPDKKVIMPVPDAGCPMADMITAEELIDFKNKYPDYIVMCYVNSTAEIKALSDICCTSSNAVKIAQKIPTEKGIIFVPDKYLGSWVQEKTDHSMALWDGFCPTHLRIEPEMILDMKQEHPEAKVLVHPEATKQCRDLGDQVLSTGGMCSFAKEDNCQEFIIATETGILHTLKKHNPEKSFYAINDHAVCPNMKKGSLTSVLNALEGTGGAQISVPEEIAQKAIHSLQKMIEMSK